ncbi:hypothetical protein L9F63_012026, partial [Diploptera punctata]
CGPVLSTISRDCIVFHLMITNKPPHIRPRDLCIVYCFWTQLVKYSYLFLATGNVWMNLKRRFFISITNLMIFRHVCSVYDIEWVYFFEIIFRSRVFQRSQIKNGTLVFGRRLSNVDVISYSNRFPELSLEPVSNFAIRLNSLSLSNNLYSLFNDELIMYLLKFTKFMKMDLGCFFSYTFHSNQTTADSLRFQIFMCIMIFK